MDGRNGLDWTGLNWAMGWGFCICALHFARFSPVSVFFLFSFLKQTPFSVLRRYLPFYAWAFWAIPRFYGVHRPSFSVFLPAILTRYIYHVDVGVSAGGIWVTIGMGSVLEWDFGVGSLVAWRGLVWPAWFGADGWRSDCAYIAF